MIQDKAKQVRVPKTAEAEVRRGTPSGASSTSNPPQRHKDHTKDHKEAGLFLCGPLCDLCAFVVGFFRPGVQLLAAALLSFVMLAGSVSAAQLTGEQIYRKRCASCHGMKGEGAKKYKKPLAGNKSSEQLAKLIAKTMPEDEPGTCTGPESEKVAAYIYDAFYSVAARERNKPPRVDLARLTVKQYRNAVADLVGTFRPPAKLDSRPWTTRRVFRGPRLSTQQARHRSHRPRGAFQLCHGHAGRGLVPIIRV